MFNSSLHKALILITFVSLLIFLYQFNSTSKHDYSQTCEVYAQKCTVMLDQGQMIIDFPQQLVVEEMLTVHITLPATLKVDQIFIEGVNMYMGKTPVHIFSQETDSQNGLSNELIMGEFFLGSCHLDDMQWQMVVNLKRVENKQQPILVTDNSQPFTELLPVSVLFNTSQSL